MITWTNQLLEGPLRIKTRTSGAALLALLTCITGFPGSAGAAPSVRAYLDRNELQVGEQVTLSLEISGDRQVSPGRPELESIDGLRILSQGTSNQINMVNGTVAVTFIHRFVIIPQREGEFSIPSIRIPIDGHQFRTQPIKITVHGNQSQPTVPEGADPSKSEGLFLKTNVPQRPVYVGEAVAYQSYLLADERLKLVPPLGLREDATFTGFTVENLEPSSQMRRATYDNRPYLVAEISRKILLPNKPGKLKITPETLEVKVRAPQERRDPYGRRRRDPFGFDDPFGDDFFQGFFGPRPVTKIVSGSPVTIEVRPLPIEGRPADFSGLVGKTFALSAQVDRKTLKQDEVVTLKVTIKGEGDIRPAQPPPLEVENDFKVFRPKSTPKIEIESDRLIGEKTFEIVLGPRRTGTLSIPPVSFSYFDVDKDSFITLKTTAFQIEVETGEMEQSLSSDSLPATRKLEILGADLQFIDENADRIRSVELRPYRTLEFWLLNALAFLVLGGATVFRRRRDRFENDIGLIRRTRAHEQARATLRRLSGKNAPVTVGEFYDCLAGLLRDYIGNKFNVPPAGIVVDEVHALLDDSVDEQYVTKLQEILSRTEMVRFAPSAVGEHRERDLEEASQIVDSLEEVLR